MAFVRFAVRLQVWVLLEWYVEILVPDLLFYFSQFNVFQNFSKIANFVFNFFLLYFTVKSVQNMLYIFKNLEERITSFFAKTHWMHLNFLQIMK